MTSSSVTVRAVEWRAAPGGQVESVLTIDLEHPLTRAHRAAIEADLREAMGIPVPGVVALQSGELDPDQIRLGLASVPHDAIRLDALFACFSAHGFPFGPMIALFLVDRVGRTLSALHATPSPSRGRRLLPSFDPASVVIGGQGTPELLAFGLPHLDEILTSCRGPSRALRHREPPELRLGGGVDVRAAVHGLGALYYELLSGRPYGEAILSEDGITENPLPGALPDPRPTLVQLLECALSEAPEHRFSTVEGFLQAMHREAGALSKVDAQILLARLMREVVPRDMPRGPGTLLARGVELPPPLETFRGQDPASYGPVLVFEPLPQFDVTSRAPATPTPVLTPPVPAPMTPAPMTPASGGARRSESAMARPQATPPRGRPRREEPSGPELRGAAPRAPRRARTISPAYLALAAILIALAGGGLVFRKLKRGPITEDRPELEAIAPEPATAPTPSLMAPRVAQPAKGATKGLLSIMSQPLGATIEIDGGYVGKTPFVMSHSFDRKTYKVRLTLEGHAPWERAVDFDLETQRLNVMATLEPSTSEEVKAGRGERPRGRGR